MKVGIYSRKLADNHFILVKELLDKLFVNKFEVILFEPFYDFIKQHIKIDKQINTFKDDVDLEDVNFMFSIGGDGTLLESVSFVNRFKVPILGINTGRLGFLTAVSSAEIDVAISALISKDFHIDRRSLLDVELIDNPFGSMNFALNEVTIQKKDSSSMITIHTYLDGIFLNSYWADGLIVSTPTGSTAYSLSCNGPIVLPNSGNIIITPIAPHNLNVRPLVIPDQTEIRLKIEGREDNYLVALDYKTETIPVSTEIIIKKSQKEINLIRLKNHDFLNTLRNKLMWGIDKRN